MLLLSMITLGIFLPDTVYCGVFIPVPSASMAPNRGHPVLQLWAGQKSQKVTSQPACRSAHPPLDAILARETRSFGLRSKRPSSLGLLLDTWATYSQPAPCSA